MKKLLTMILIISLMATMLLGCGREKDPSDQRDTSAAPPIQGEEDVKPVEIKQTDLIFTGIGFNLKDGIDPKTNKEYQGWETFVQEQFNEKFPNVNLEVNTIPWENFRAKLQTILQSNGTDLLYASGSFTAFFHKQGLLMGLNKFIESDPSFNFEDEYPAGLRKNMNLTDYTTEELVALPFILGNRIIIYDKQIFDDWGVEYLSEHPTPEEILEKASQMTGKNPKTGKQNYGLWYDGKSMNLSWFLALGYYFDVVGCEGTLDNLKELKWSINSPEVLKTLEWCCEAAKYCPPSFVNSQGNENFGTENNDVAIAIDTNGVKIMNEYMKTEDEALLDRYEPTLHFGPKGEGWAVADGIAMSAKIKEEDQAVAWEVCKYLAGSETQKWFYEQFGPSPMASKDTSFYHPKDKYLLMNMKVVENSHSGAFEELNPFFVSDIQPFVTGIISKYAVGQKIDLQAELESLQRKAEVWSSNQE